MRSHFWHRVKIKTRLLSGPLSESSLAFGSALGARAQPMLDLLLGRGYESLSGSARSFKSCCSYNMESSL